MAGSSFASGVSLSSFSLIPSIRTIFGVVASFLKCAERECEVDSTHTRATYCLLGGSIDIRFGRRGGGDIAGDGFGDTFGDSLGEVFGGVRTFSRAAMPGGFGRCGRPSGRRGGVLIFAAFTTGASGRRYEDDEAPAIPVSGRCTLWICWRAPPDNVRGLNEAEGCFMCFVAAAVVGVGRCLGDVSASVRPTEQR